MEEEKEEEEDSLALRAAARRSAAHLAPLVRPRAAGGFDALELFAQGRFCEDETTLRALLTDALPRERNLEHARLARRAWMANAPATAARFWPTSPRP